MEETIARLRSELTAPKTPLPIKMRNIFTLRGLGGEKAIDAMAAGFDDDSALLRHEIAYCLGQTTDPYAIPVLTRVLENKDENSMVRHEAAEALGAIGCEGNLEVLEAFAKDELPEVSETCELALDRIKWLQSEEAKALSEKPKAYLSVDPAPPCGGSVDDMRATLLDENKSLWERYRAMFGLRDNGSKEAVDALSAGLLQASSALMRHEVAYVMGQMQDDGATEALRESLSNTKEHAMVRHEAAEALGAIASERTLPILHSFLKDPERVVRESCEIALDIHDHEQSNDFQWADGVSRSEPAAVTV